MIASPIGKSDISRGVDFERDRLETAIRMADAFGTRMIRVFSFYLDGRDRTECRDEVVERLSGFAARAASANLTLLLENEGGLWGDTPERCADLHGSSASCLLPTSSPLPCSGPC